MPKYRFDEIAINSTEKKKPAETDKETYIGLEHLDSGILEVTRWGAEVAPVGDKLVMRKGDILFGRRRAYQKKVAIAPFDGIFSAHGMVLRPIETVISKEFFPFFISSDYFLDAAIQISVGSLSPTINWRDLCKLEFEIPTIEEQRELSPILWGMNRLKAAYSNLLQQMDALVQSQFVEMFGDVAENPMQWPEATLNDVCIGKLSYGSGAAAVDYDGSTRYVRITDITENGELSNDVKSPNIIEEKYLLHDGDILFARSGATVGKTLRFREQFGRCIYAGFLIRLIPDRAKVVPDYVFGFTKSSFYEEFVRKTQRAVGQPNINAQEYGDLKICVPPLELQREFSSFLAETDKSKLAIQQALDSLEKSRNAIMKKVFG